MAARIRVGTCSWADEALSKHLYPPGSRQASGLPTTPSTSTPSSSTRPTTGFRSSSMVAALGGADARGLRHACQGVRRHDPPPGQEGAAAARPARRGAGRRPRPHRPAAARVPRRGLPPLSRRARAPARRREARRDPFQFPPYVVYKPRRSTTSRGRRNRWARRDARRVPSPAWFEEDVRADVLSWLEEHGMASSVDAPKIERRTCRPPSRLTSPVAYVRIHGRNARTWNVRGRSAAERFDHLYSEDELHELVEPLKELAAGAKNAYAFFNNNNRSPSGDGGFVARSRQRTAAQATAVRNSCRSSLKCSGRSRFVKWPVSGKTSSRPSRAPATIPRASSTDRNGSRSPTATQSGPQRFARRPSRPDGRAEPRASGRAPPPCAGEAAAPARREPRLRFPPPAASGFPHRARRVAWASRNRRERREEEAADPGSMRAMARAA